MAWEEETSLCASYPSLTCRISWEPQLKIHHHLHSANIPLAGPRVFGITIRKNRAQMLVGELP